MRLKKIAHLKNGHLILLERANFGLWGDITSAENRVPSPGHLMSPLGVPPPSPFGVTSFMDGPLNLRCTCKKVHPINQLDSRVRPSLGASGCPVGDFKFICVTLEAYVTTLFIRIF